MHLRPPGLCADLLSLGDAIGRPAQRERGHSRSSRRAGADGADIELQLIEIDGVLHAGIDYCPIDHAGLVPGAGRNSFPPQVIDMYLAGVKAQAQTVIGEAHEAVGGKETFDKMRQWAATSLNEAELKAYNSAAQGGGEQYKLALASLNAKYRAAVGNEPTLLGDASVAHGSVDVFNSQADLQAAIRDPRYGKDRAYTQPVEQKLSRSRI